MKNTLPKLALLMSLTATTAFAGVSVQQGAAPGDTPGLVPNKDISLNQHVGSVAELKKIIAKEWDRARHAGETVITSKITADNIILLDGEAGPLMGQAVGDATIARINDAIDAGSFYPIEGRFKPGVWRKGSARGRGTEYTTGSTVPGRLR